MRAAAAPVRPPSCVTPPRPVRRLLGLRDRRAADTRSTAALHASDEPRCASITPVAFLGLGTMGAAMAANLARAGFPVTGWNRTPGRAPDLPRARGHRGGDAARPAAAWPTSWSSACRTPPTSRPCCSGRTASWTGPDPGTLVDRLLDHRPVGLLGLRRAPARARPGDGRCARLGRQRGRAQRHADDLRRRRRGRRRARPAGPRRRWAGPSRTSVRSAPARRSRPSTR